MINIQNVTYSYGLKKNPVLDDFSLSLRHGGVVGLLGPNGAGKSTLLYLMTGTLLPRHGEVTYDGVSVGKRLPRILSDIYLVPEEIHLPDMTLKKYVESYKVFYPNFSEETFSRATEVFGIDSSIHLRGLSMGQKKKAAISFALACHTPVLLMDEPTNGLDIPGKAAFRRLVAETMTDNRLILISTHQVRDLDQLLDHIVVMNRRQVLLDRPIAEIQKKLLFLTTSNPETISNSLLSIPVPGGMDVILPNDGDQESTVNLEMLFELALNHHDLLARTLN